MQVANVDRITEFRGLMDRKWTGSNPNPILVSLLDPIVDKKSSAALLRGEIEACPDSKRVLSWLLRNHVEYHFLGFEDQGLILEDAGRHRAYFAGTRKGERMVVWNSAQRRGIKREVVKRRADGPRAWFENEGFGYEVVDLGGSWCLRIKPFYMFTGQNARTPLPSFARAAKATRRIKFDRNKNVEADLAFWANFIGRGAETIYGCCGTSASVCGIAQRGALGCPDRNVRAKCSSIY